jgi:ABC-type lipoprotein release transport system permease subunit
MTRRRRELAVRMALGAHPSQVSRLLMASGLKLAGAGVVVGLTAALLGAAAMASWLPARRATRVSPAEVLRGE